MFREGVRCHRRMAAQIFGRNGRLDDHGTEVVGQRIVELPRNAQALLRRGLVVEIETGAAQVFGLARELFLREPVPSHGVAEKPCPRDDNHDREERCAALAGGW